MDNRKSIHLCILSVSDNPRSLRKRPIVSFCIFRRTVSDLNPKENQTSLWDPYYDICNMGYGNYPDCARFDPGCDDSGMITFYRILLWTDQRGQDLDRIRTDGWLRGRFAGAIMPGVATHISISSRALGRLCRIPPPTAAKPRAKDLIRAALSVGNTNPSILRRP